ncbi:hypothetical protein CVT24_010450 [Panaeolus cyanescens]|uniref:Uncharacterized protein n=1 Tax=Panaeolus cyanescens TaxID=181874 RepID=A0A409YPQ8_9AGAR|nr:hypothetical protein CVT24_010450 [Panaeolus cyanescens]
MEEVRQVTQHRASERRKIKERIGYKKEKMDEAWKLHQWGLDAGHHQDDWNPYFGLPNLWVVSDHMYDDDLIQIGPNYVEINPPPKPPSDTEKKRKQRPLPVPRQKQAKS